MPRKKKPVQEVVEAQAAELVPSLPVAPPAAYFHATPREPEPAQEDASFDVAALEKPRPKLACIADDRRNGIRIEVETSRQPGQVSPRVFIRFEDDKRPSVDEKKMLHAEGFAYQLQEKAWAAPKSAVNTLLAKRCVNEITKLRDPDGLLFPRLRVFELMARCR